MMIADPIVRYLIWAAALLIFLFASFCIRRQLGDDFDVRSLFWKSEGD